jgi:hypothetical protein
MLEAGKEVLWLYKPGPWFTSKALIMSSRSNELRKNATLEKEEVCIGFQAEVDQASSLEAMNLSLSHSQPLWELVQTEQKEWFIALLTAKERTSSITRKLWKD